MAIHADGTLQETATDGTTSIGSWEATGPDSFNLTFHSLSLTGSTDRLEGSFAMSTIRSTGEVSEDGQSFTAEYTVELTGEGAPAGQFGPGSVTGTRINVEPMGTPVAPVEALFPDLFPPERTAPAGTAPLESTPAGTTPAAPNRWRPHRATLRWQPRRASSRLAPNYRFFAPLGCQSRRFAQRRTRRRDTPRRVPSASWRSRCASCDPHRTAAPNDSTERQGTRDRGRSEPHFIAPATNNFNVVMLSGRRVGRVLRSDP